MLQLISGKFFQANTLEDLEIFNLEEIIYSNYHSYSKNITIKSGKIQPLKERDPIISLTPLKNFKNEINIFLMNYLVTFEKKYIDHEGFMPAFPGNKEIIGSICNLLTFHFDALFSSHLNDIETLILKDSKQNRFFKFTERFTSQEIICDPLAIDNFSEFANKVISIEQITYAVILKSINVYVSAIKYHKSNPFMSYILLIFALENLVSLFDDSEPSWHFIDKDLRNSFENDIFPECSEEVISRIKALFLSKNHYKLSQKFKDFCISKINPSFYIEEANNIIGAAKESEIVDALNGLYQIRSLFVHTLTVGSPLSMSKYSSTEIIELQGQHHFSFTGLLRLTKHILKNSILDKSLLRVDVEPYDYFEHLPEFTTDNLSMPVKSSATACISKTTQLNQNNSREFISNLLEQHFQSLIHHSPITSMYNLMKRIPKDIHGIKEEQEKIPLIILFEFYFNFIPEQKTWLSYDKALLDSLTIESFLYKVLLDKNISPWTASNLEECYKNYEKNKGKKINNKVLLHLNNYYELLLLSTIANKYLDEGNILKHAEIFNKILRESPSNEYLLKLLNTDEKDDFINIDISSLKTSIILQEYKKRALDNTKEGQINLLNIARCYDDLEFYNEAIQIYSEIIKLDATCAETLNDLANCYLNINDLSKAESSILEALKANDQLWYVNATRAEILLKKGELHNAYRWYYRALNLNRTDMSKLLSNKGILEDIQTYCHNIIKDLAHNEHLKSPRNNSYENWLNAEKEYLAGITEAIPHQCF